MLTKLADQRNPALIVQHSGESWGNPSLVVWTIFHVPNTACQQMATNNHRLGHGGEGEEG